LLITDLDGTLLDPTGRIHRADGEAIALLKKRGVPVTICTGRMYSGTRNIAEQLGLDGPVACIDGCHIVHTGTRQDLYVAELAGPEQIKLRDALRQVGLSCFAFASDVIVYDRFGRRYLKYLRTWSERMLEIESVTSERGWASLSQLGAIVALGSRADVETVTAELATIDSEPFQFASFPMRASGRDSLWALIVRCAGVDKGTATCFLAEYHGVPLEQVVVVGDWINDVPMFKVAGHSFVMAQAPIDVKGSAKAILRAHTYVGGGIREAAERAGLL
jgi:Cof subfamily protein (haloacid dehalogenase superfamily)